MSETLTLQRSLIRRDGGTQPRAALHPPTVQNYAEALARGEDLPPVDVFYDGTTYWLADGFHRDDAHDERDLDEIGATIHQGTQRDAILFSVGANAAHGLPRSNEDKRRAVLRLLEDEEWRTWSNRKIADVCRVSHPFVGDIRAELYPDDDGKRKAIRDGKEYTVASGNISRSNAERAAQADDEFEIHPLSAIGQVIEGLDIAAEFGGPIQVFPWEDRHDVLDGVATAVNVTSQGMVGEAALDLRLDKLSDSALAADIIYTPLETPFLAAAREHGNRTINGLGMLLHQGPPAWKMWFDVEPVVTEELREQMEQSIAGG